MLCVPKIYVPIATCMLRVINNDTNKEIPRVFQKVAPYVYKKNKVCIVALSPRGGVQTKIIIIMEYFINNRRAIHSLRKRELWNIPRCPTNGRCA